MATTPPSIQLAAGPSGTFSQDPASFIRVMAQLPVARNGVFEWHFVPLLSIPRSGPQHINNGADILRWIRYAAGAVLGTSSVTLSYTRDLTLNFEYDAPLPDAISDIYAHVAEADRGNLLPAEPDLVAKHTGTSWSTEHRAKAKPSMDKRDGTCVITDDDEMCCDDVHLIPHIKGDEYIRLYTEAASLECGVINNIDDVRNMIRLSATLHKGLGKFLAIMPRPNFAFPFPTARSWEYHPLKDGPRAYQQRIPVREPTGTQLESWPPDQLFNHVYGAAVLHAFGVGPEANAALLDMTARYYGLGGRKSAQERVQAQLKQRRAKQEDARNNTQCQDEFPMFGHWQHVLPREIRAELYTHCKQKAEKAVQETSAAKVDAWRKTLST
ncbi:hypothetical protein BKA62DRAFT_755761 [Auriculariales sp. MPI-PUGE-AT-0066]|nr:hypothetical protein BKA62DRAFT_755761 [Auriculariales sp. MPI-PUGE-AT-0066]